MTKNNRNIIDMKEKSKTKFMNDVLQRMETMCNNIKKGKQNET